MFRDTLAWLFLALILLAVAPASSADNATMIYHWGEGGLSRYRSITVIIQADGRTNCMRDSYGIETAEIVLSPQEIAYYKYLFDHVVALDRTAIEVPALDTGITTWCVTNEDETRKLTYIFTQDPWASAAERAIYRLTSRTFLLSGTGLPASDAAYPDLFRDAALTAPETMRDRLRAELKKRVLLQGTPGGQWQNAAGILKQLAYYEPPEMWAGEVMLTYEQANRELRFALLRAIAEHNFDIGEERPRSYLLVPVMIEGLQWLLDISDLPTGGPEWVLSISLIHALGSQRDSRAIEVLSSDKLWEERVSNPLPETAAQMLCQIGLPGVLALEKKIRSDDPFDREVAARELRRAAPIYGLSWIPETPHRRPSPAHIDEVRKYLFTRGLAPEGIDAFDIPEAAAAAFHHSFPDWSYIPTGEFGGPALEGWNDYEIQLRGPQRCWLDFDCNDLEDIALLVRKGDTMMLIVLLQKPDNQWQAHPLIEFPAERASQEGYLGLVASIAPVPPTEVFAAGAGASELVLESPAPGLELRWGAERGRTVFFWDY